MKPKLYTFIFLGIACITGFSCKTASKLYEKGHYDEAVLLAAKKLQKKPDDAGLADVLRQAYAYAVSEHESNLRSFSESSNELKWEWMYNTYVSLQKLYDAIYHSPAVFTIVNPVDYSSQLVTYREKAGDIRYDRGLTFMLGHDKQSYRNAYREFQAALRFKPGHRDIVQKAAEAYDYAVTNVVVLPLQQHGGFVYSSYSIGGNNFDDRLIRDLQYNSGSEFVQFYSAWDARSRNIRVDHELEMRLANVQIGHPYDNKTTRKLTKEIVVKETVYKPDSVVKEYATVTASLTTTRRTLHSAARLLVTVRDAGGRWLWSDDFAGHHNWATEFFSYTGDARALSDADLQLVNRRQEFAPTENEIMRLLLEQIGQDARYRVASYFSRF